MDNNGIALYIYIYIYNSRYLATAVIFLAFNMKSGLYRVFFLSHTAVIKGSLKVKFKI